MEKINYKGKVCVVTGAASGMGLSVVKMLSELDAEIIGVDIKEVPVPVKKFIQMNLASKDSIDAGIAQMPEHIDCIFSCAGVAGVFYAGREFDVIDVMKINYVGPIYMIEALVPRMSEGGAIAMIASIGGMGWMASLPTTLQFLAIKDYDEKIKYLEANRDNPQVIGGPRENNRVYCFSKECLITYAKQQSWLLSAKKIRINTLSPGSTATPMLNDFNTISGVEGGTQEESCSLVKVSATPEDQAKAIIYLNSDYASYVSGVDLQVDYGFTGGVFTGLKVFGNTPDKQ